MSRVDQDLTAQRLALVELGVATERVHVDHGLTGTNRGRPGLREALAACRAGDTLVVTKLDRLARSVPDAREIADELAGRHVALQLGTSVHDPTDPVGRLLFHVLAMVADLVSMRTREVMRIAKANGRLRGKKPKLSPTQEATWSTCTTPAPTPRQSWPNCSTSPAPPSTGPSPGRPFAPRPVRLRPTPPVPPSSRRT